MGENTAEKSVARILFVGDIHIGRRPARLPDDLAEFDISPTDLTPAAAFKRAVRFAVEQAVDAVVMAGDVVERENYRFEAFGTLQLGVNNLVQAGIPVMAVAGNHDQDALPLLARSIEEFSLVGRGGKWERVRIFRADTPLAHLVGWSFPSPVVKLSPLDEGSLPSVPNDGLPVLGVMHCDLDGGGQSIYAPVPRINLERTDYNGWFLGHIHNPSDLTAKPHIGYLGSLVGLDPTETGAHGPWLVEIDGSGGMTARHVPLSPLRWERTAVNVDGLETADDLMGLVTRALEELHRRLLRGLGETRVVGCRLILEGQTPLHGEIDTVLASGRLQEIRRTADQVLYFVDKVSNRSRPTLDLESIARGGDPAALLARQILAVERGEAEGVSLVRGAMKEIERESNKPHWAQLEPAGVDEKRVRELLIESGLTALRELLEQVDASGRAGDSG